MSKHPKIKLPEELAAIVRRLRQSDKTVVFANGCFDLLHGGHVSYLEGAAELGDVLIVGINSDASVHLLKGKNRPIVPENERAEIVAAFEAVDYVVLFNEPKCDAILEKLRPDIHAKGTDYTEKNVPERETAIALDIEIAITGDPKQNATRDIIKRIAESK